MINTKELINDILSDDLEQAYMRITAKAVEWAVAGFIKEANQLLETLWSFGIEHTRHVWLPDEGFQVMWELSNTAPSNIPFQPKNTKDIEQENFDNFFIPFGGRPGYSINKPISKSDGAELFAKVWLTIHDNSESLFTILDAIEKSLNSNEVVGYSYFQAATSGSLLAAKNDLTAEAIKFIQYWGKGYLKYSTNYMLSYLMRDKATARILLSGLLAPVFGFTEEKCLIELKEIGTALAERMTKGRILVYGNLTWNELLSKISHKAIELETYDFSNDAINFKWLGKAPASKTDIKEAENRLGIVLPDDYKEFLLTTNGFESISNIGVKILPIHKVDYFRNFEEDSVESWSETMRDIDASFSKNFRNSILIGGYEEEQQILLIPLPNNNWECWFFAHWFPGETKYPSFRFYMEEQLQRLEGSFYTD